MKKLQLAQTLNHNRLDDVWRFIYETLASWLPVGRLEDLHRLYDHTIALYQGEIPGYQACKTEYHNLRHTIDVTVATVRLIDGYNLEHSPLGEELIRETCEAALLHDVGYIQESSDTEGTGAKYTKTHVARGVAYLATYAKVLGLEPHERRGRLIWGTDLAKPWTSIGFSSDLEEKSAALLATGDLLGQMADRAYLEKLLFLYYEFREAGFSDYQTEFDMLKKTLGFFDVIQKRLDTTLSSVYNLATAHFRTRLGLEANLYTESIEGQKSYLKTVIDDTVKNFRQKLKRLDLEKAPAPAFMLSSMTTR